MPPKRYLRIGTKLKIFTPEIQAMPKLFKLEKKSVVFAATNLCEVFAFICVSMYTILYLFFQFIASPKEESLATQSILLITSLKHLS